MTPKLASWLTAAVFCLAQLLWPAAAQAAPPAGVPAQTPLAPCLEPLPEEADPPQDWIAIRPLLRDGEDLYEVAYRKTSGFRNDSPLFFASLSPEYVKTQGITGLRVTKNGVEVNDPAEVARVFVLYRAAYHLYADPLPVVIPKDITNLKLITDFTWPVALGTLANQLRKDKSVAYEDLLLMLLTDQTERTRESIEEALGPGWDASFSDLGAVMTLLETAAVAGERLAGPAAGLAKTLNLLQSGGRFTGLAAPAAAAGAKVAYVWLVGVELQQERAPWLEHYLEALPGSAGGMSTEQRQAAHAVLVKVQETADLRKELSQQIVLETALQMGTGYITPIAFEALGAVLGSRAASGLLSVSGKVLSPSGLLGAWGAGLTVTGAWYNADEWYADFVLAQHALELRKAFETGVNSLRQTAVRQARLDPEAYDGELAESYKAAFLLEMLAAVESQRLFSNGYEAIFRTPNLLTGLDKVPLPIRPAAQREAARSAKEEAEAWGQQQLNYFDLLLMKELLPPLLAQPAPPAARTGTFAVRGEVLSVESANAVAAEGGNLYALSSNSLSILSLADPDRPELLGELALDGAFAADLEVRGRCAYVLQSNKLLVVDVEDSAAPAILSTYDIRWPQGAYMDVEIGTLDGHLMAYIADGGDSENIGDSGYWPGEILALDLSAPYGIHQVQNMHADGWPVALKVDGPYLYVGLSTGKHGNTGGYHRIHFFEYEGANADLSVELPESVLAFETAGTYIYLGTNFWGNGSIRVADLSDPDRAVEVAALDYGATASLLRIGATLFATTSEGLIAFDLSTPSEPVEVGRLADVAFGDMVYAAGRLYVAEWEGLTIVDVGPFGVIAEGLALDDTIGRMGVDAATEDAGDGSGASGAEVDDEEVDEEVGTVDSAELSVLVENLNVRAGPGTGFPIVQQVDEGQRLSVTGRNADGSWLAVCCAGGQQGWVILNSQYVQYGGDVESLPVQTEPETSQPEPGESPQASIEEAESCSVAAAGSLEEMQAAAGLGCASTTSSITWAAYTPFEGGFILWRRDTQQIYGFFTDGTWRAVPDGWNGSSPPPSRGSPPPGRLEPVRGAGWVWGTDDVFFEKLGWATAEQTGFCAEVQTFANGFALRSSTAARCDDENANPVQNADFLNLAAGEDGTWMR